MTQELPHKVVVKEYHNGDWYATRGWEDDTEVLQHDGTWILVDDMSDDMEVASKTTAFATREEAETAIKAAGEPEFEVETKEDQFDPMQMLLQMMAEARS